MNAANRRSLTQAITTLLLLALLVSPMLPLLAEQPEITAEPAPPTDAPVTETSAPPTEEPVVPTVVEPTDPPAEPDTETPVEPEIVPTDPVEVPTIAPVEPLPPTPYTPDTFYSDFMDGSNAAWLLSVDWTLEQAYDSVYLRTDSPAQTATVNGLLWEHVLLNARLGLTPGAVVNVAVRVGAQSYTVRLSEDGHVALYRGDTLLRETPPVMQPETTPDLQPVAAPTWFQLGLMASGGTLSVALNDVFLFDYTDPHPLPAGLIVFGSSASSTGAVMLDVVEIHRLPAPLPVEPTAPPTPIVIPTQAPVTDEPAEPPPLEPTDEPVEITAEPTPEPVEVTEEPISPPTDQPAEVVIPELTPELDQPELTPAVDPEATPELDEPELTPELTPEADPEATPELDEPELTPEADPEATPELDEPELTPEVDPEATPELDEPELTPELTPAVDPEATPELDQPELTPELTPAGPEPLLYTDFETEPLDWTLDPEAQIITVSSVDDSHPLIEPEAEVTPDLDPADESQPEDTSAAAPHNVSVAPHSFSVAPHNVSVAPHQVGQFPPNASLRPAREIYLSDQQIDARLQIVDDAQDGSASGLVVVLRSGESGVYLLSVELEQTTLYRRAGEVFDLVEAVPAQRQPGVWYALSVVAEGDTIRASVDGVEALTFTDAQPLLAGRLELIANAASTVWLDTVAVYDLAPAADVPATDLPYTLDESLRLKFNSSIFELLQAHLEGPEAEAAIEQMYVYHRDEAGRLLVGVWTVPGAAEGFAAQIEQMGGEVTLAEDNRIQAFVPLAGLATLAQEDDVLAIVPPVLAQSTSSSAPAPAAAPSAPMAAAAAAPANSPGMGNVRPHSLDLLGVNAWHNAGFTGQGVNIAVVDLGFAFPTGSSVADRACLGSTTVINGAGTSSHGAEVVEVLCDVAPDARVWMYRAADEGQMQSRINQAIAGGASGFPAADVIVVTMDPGGTTTSSVLADILQTAQNNHIPVIASAGNRGQQAQVEFIYSGSGVSRVTISYRLPDNFAPAESRIVVNAQNPAKNPTQLISNNSDWSQYNPPTPGDFSYLVPVDACLNGFCNLTLEILPGADLGFTGGQETFKVSVTVPSSGATITPDGTVTYPAAGSQNRLTPVARHPSVLAVGAVCGWQDQRYPLLPDSSTGPLGQVGNASIKPELVAPSRVNTSIHPNVNNVVDCNPTNNFGGTSASAAHVGGMAALAISNPNMVGIYGQPPGTPNTLKAYLMSRAVDVNGNGYDHAYGAGVAQLGNPNFNLLAQRVIPREANLLMGEPVVYVASAYQPLGTDVPNGTPNRPYTSIPHAVRRAQDQGISTIVAMPGEYTTAFSLPAGMRLVSYDIVDQADRLPSHIWVNDTLANGEGIGITGANVTVEGFLMTGSRPAYTYSQASLATSRTMPFQLGAAADNINIIDNTFSSFDQPLRISNTSTARLAGNTFEDFYTRSADGLNQAGVIYIVNSGSESNPILLEYNRFLDNEMQLDTLTATSPWQEPVVGIRRSAVNLYHNRFENNRAESVIAIDQWLEGQEPTGTLFTSGDPDASIAANKAGRFVNLPVVIYGSFFDGMDTTRIRDSLVQVYQLPRLRFINNTVTNYRFSSQNNNFNNIVTIGHGGTHFTHVSDHRWELHNNIFFNINTSGALIRMGNGQSMNQQFGQRYGCLPIGAAPISQGTIPNSSGARNNWFAPAFTTAGGVSGDCGDVVGTPGAAGSNNNFTQTWPEENGTLLVAFSEADEAAAATARAGFVSNYFLDSFDPAHRYRLRPADNHPALDNANLSAWQAIFGTYNGDIHRDLFGGERIVDRTNVPPTALLLDRGAYEMGDPDPVRFINGDGTLQATISEGGTVYLQMDSRLEMGYRPYTIQFSNMPTIYDDDPNNDCRGEPYLFNPATYQLTYCPPPYLYTIDELVDALTFQYRALGTLNTGVTDWANAIMTVTPVNDGPPGSSNVAQRHILRYNQPESVPLRPYAEYSATSFFLSDPSGDSKAVDYPFTYTNLQIDVNAAGFNPRLFNATYPQNGSQLSAGQIAAINTQLQNAVINGRLAMFSPGGLYTTHDERGIFEFTYSVTDGFGQTAANSRRARIQVVDRALLFPGFYDDANVNIIYSDSSGDPLTGNWQARRWATTYNNTFHFTSTSGDTVDINFVGTAFTLYMLGHPSGGNYRLELDASNVAGRLNYNAPALINAGITCNTTIASTPSAGIISNRLSTVKVYGVTCQGFPETEVHRLRITDQQQGAFTILDAIAIYSGQPLTEGFYDEYHAAFKYTSSWLNLNSDNARRGTLRYTSDRNASMSFYMRGSGLRIFRTLASNRGSYQVCIDANIDVLCNERVVNVNNYSISTQWAVPYTITGLNPSQTYLVSIRNFGGAGPFWDIDDIEILPQMLTLTEGLYQETFLGISYSGNWLNLNNASASGGSLRYTSDSNASVDFQFTGTGITLYRTMANNRGTYEVCVQSLPCEVVNSNYPTVRWNQPHTINGLPFGTYTVTITNFSPGPFNDIDAIRVINQTQPLRAGLHQETNPNIVFSGNWQSLNSTSVSGGTLRYTTDSNASAWFDFEGTGIVLLRTMATNRGTFRVCVDADPAITCNEVVRVVSSNASTVSWSVPHAIAGLPFGTYRVTIDQLVPGPFIDLDAVRVLDQALQAGLYQENHPGIAYTGSWLTLSNTSTNGGQLLYTSSTSASTQLRFEGSGVVLYRTLASNRGTYDVCIDADATVVCNETVVTVNSSNPATVWNVPFVIDMPYGAYTLTLANFRNGTFWDVDAIQVIPEHPLPVGFHEENHPGIIYSGNWNTLSNSTTTGGRLLFSSDSSAAVEFAFEGDGLAIFRTLASNRGAYRLCINGVDCRVIDSFASTTQWAAPYIVRGLGPGVHHARIDQFQLTGTRGFVDLDAIQVLPATSPLVTGTVYQEDDADILLIGPWLNLNRTGTNAGALRYTSLITARAQFTFTGTGITLYRTLASNRSSFQVCIDPVSAGTTCQATVRTVNNNATVVQWNQPFTIQDLPDDTYQVTIRHLGTATFIDLDAVEVIPSPGVLLPGRYQASNPNITYNGSWLTLTNNSAFGGSLLYTSSSSASAQFTFEGEGFVLYRTVASNRGAYRVCVDAVGATPCTTPGQQYMVNSTNAATRWQSPYSISGLVPGQYQVTINQFINGSFWDVDAVEILGSRQRLEAGYYEQDNPNLWYYSSNGQPGGNWWALANSSASGGSTHFSQQQNDYVEFDMTGAGVSVYTVGTPSFSDLRLCYGEVDPLDNCRVLSTKNTTVTFGFAVSVFDMPYGDYTVRLYNNKDSFLHIDGVGIIGQNAPITAGELADDRDARIGYVGLDQWWVTQTFASGPLNNTQRASRQRGALAYFTIEGSAFTLYHTVADSYSQHIRVCVISDVLQCTLISQRESALGWQRAITFDSLGEGTHQVIIENLDPGRWLNIDAIRVHQSK